MHLQSSGNVGIGDTTPTQLLTVGSGDLFTVDSTGNMVVSGTANLNGDTTIGNAITDNITFTGRVALDSDLIPIGTSGTNDLGSSTLPWDNIYVDNIYSSGSINGFWQRNLGVLSPTNVTDDLLVGLTATPSAATSNYFQVFGTGSTEGNASSSGILTLGTNRTAGIIETERMLPLTLGSSTTGAITLDAGSGNITLSDDTVASGDLAINGGDITSTQTSFNLLNATVTTLNIGGALTTLNLADAATTKTIDIGGVDNSGTDTINIATNGTAADGISIGNTNAATTVAITGGDDWSITGTGILTMSASAAQTTAIDITDTSYTNSLSIADNTITGTTANIDLTNFDVVGSSGDITTAGDIAINGNNITSTGDLDINVAGNDVTSPDRWTIGSSTAGVGQLTVTGFQVGKALAIFNETGDQNILTASASGTTVFTLTRTGELQSGDLKLGLNDTSATISTNDTNETLTLDPNGTGAVYFHGSTYAIDASGNFVIGTNIGVSGDTDLLALAANALTVNGSGTFTSNVTLNATSELRLADSDSSNYTGFKAPATVGTNIVYTLPAADGSANQVLSTNASGVLSWIDVSGGAGVGDAGYWNQSGGMLYPKNATVDLLVGGSATASAKFAFINVASGTPTATISGNLTLDAAGVIATTKMQQLTIGSSTTGPIQLSPKGTTGLFVDATGRVGIGTTGPAQALEIAGASSKIYLSNSTASNKFIFNTPGNSYMGISGSGVGGGISRFNIGYTVAPGTAVTEVLTVTDTGLVGIGTTAPTAKLDVNGFVVGKALAIFNETGNQNILVASASGVTKLTVDRNGNLNLANSEYISNATDDIVSFVGVGGSDNTDLYLNLDGTYPILYSNTDTKVGIDDDLEFVGAQSIFTSTGNLTLDAAGNLVLADTTVQLSAGSSTLDVYNAAADTTLTLANTGGSYLANLSVEGQVLPGSFSSNPTQIGNGAIIYRSDLTQLYYYNGSAWTAIGSGSGGGSLWRIISGAMSPLNDTLDVLIGGSATSSAKFAFLNVDSGTPTASISGNLALAVPTGSNPSETLNIYNGGSFNLQNSPGGDAGLTSRFFVDKAGNVGIGNTAPAVKFDITAGNLRLSDTQQVQWGGTTNYLTGSNASNYLALTTNGSEAVRVDSSGKVGIGNTAPVGKLDVNGQVKGKALTILNETGDQAILVASASGTTRFIVSNGGDVYGQRFVDLADYPGTATYLLDPAATGTSAYLAGGVRTGTGILTSGVADGATSVGFTLNTSNSLTTQGAKLLSVQSNATEKFYVDKDGNVYAAGTILAGNGAGVLMTNKSGGTVAVRSLVVIDTSNNSAFTTTTTPYAKTSFGVVTGVGVRTGDDANANGICNADDICMVAVGGEVNVTTTNASTATRGDYLFTSATAGSAVASAKQFDGLIGVVSSTANAGSGYLKMIFKVQPQVTAAASIDKGSKYNEYRLYADDYTGVGEGTSPNDNLATKGMYFDNLLDTTKTDSANTTVSAPTQVSATTGNPTPAAPFRTGLMGGQTLSAATTDNAGNTYLGSSTVNKTIYYDRTRDSTPQVLVNLGIDPNWYNGVTLAVATTSASFSQNSTVYTPNPNLSATYNGSLLLASGTYASNAKTIYITIKSPTTFDWTDYNGQASTAVTMTPGTAQTLGSTGVSVKFTKANYNTGDVFKIASWFVEPSGSTRGTKTQFPERSTIVATASSVDIIDADTQKLWMRFSQGTNYALGADANNDPSSVASLNGKLYVATNGSSATGLYTLDFVHDAAFRQNATDWRLSDTALVGRDATNTYNVINTSNILVNVTANDVSAAVIPNAPTQTMTVSSWGYIVGDGTNQIEETVNLPYKFNTTPLVSVKFAGSTTSPPTNLASCTTAAGTTIATSSNIYATTTTAFSIDIERSDNTSSAAGTYYCYSWTATGQVSPRQFAAAATDAGVTIINETDATAYSYSDVTGDDYNSVQLTSTGKMYALNETMLQLEKWRDIAGNTTSETDGTPDKTWAGPTTGDTSTVLLLHANGGDASTGFTDSSSNLKTVTAAGNAQIDTAQSKFGSGSGLFDGSGDYLNVPDSSDWDLTGDFTIDLWIRFNVVNTYQTILETANDSTPNFLRFVWDGTTNNWCWDATGNGTCTNFADTLSTNTWYHVAVTRSGTTVRLFRDGAQKGSSATDSISHYAAAAGINIGAGYLESYTLNAWLDEFRISKGVARWTAAFTPPIAPYHDMIPALTASALTVPTNPSLQVTEKTSPVGSNSDTIYVGTNQGVSVIQDKESDSTANDGTDEANGSVKYYTKDYISEEMVGDIRGTWPFNEASGSLLDASVKANYLEDENPPTYAASSVRGKGLTFDGTADHLCSDANNDGTCDYDGDFDFGTGSFSVSAWFKHSATISGTDTLIDHYYNTTPAAVLGWRVYMNSTGTITFGIDDDATSFPEDSVTSSGAYNDNLWHQVTAVKNGTTDIRLYIDGVQVGTPDTSLSATGTLTGTAVLMGVGSDCSVGAACATGANFWDGSLDELTITANALSASQIKHMYQVGYRALQSHATTLGGGGADANQQLGYISTGTNTVGAVAPDYNNQFMYVGTNSTTLGAVSKIDLNSDTNIKTYNSSANVPAGGALLIDEDTKSLAVGYTLEAVGSAASGVKTMGLDDNATATSGNFISKTYTTSESFSQAYIWSQYVTDSSDTSNTVTVSASNDGGSNYYQCTNTNTNTGLSPTEYEYFCQFNAAGSSLKLRYAFARGSTKTNTYLTRYGVAWIGSDAIGGAPGGNGLYTNNNSSVANGSYLEVAHNQNSNDLVTNGWVYDSGLAKWVQIDNAADDATGGTITHSGGYTIHTFTSNGTFTPPVAGNVEYLVVGGGGGGGYEDGGGGGAGGFRTGTGFAVTAQAYTVTVGGGGNGGTNGVLGVNGNDSVFSTITSVGGGHGGSRTTGVNGTTGGSGGGGAFDSGTGGAGTVGQGNGGGAGQATRAGGGGGGASAVGAAGSGTTGGNGGNGTASSISGSSVTYAGGGGGGGISQGSGGSGGGGAGGNPGTAGTANTGGGGGGGSDTGPGNGGNGGSGIVIIRYLINSLSAFKITQVDANTVRLYNYSGSAQNLRLDVITGGLGRNAGTVSLAPSAADVDAQSNINSIWVNKTGLDGSLLKLQKSGTDILNLSQAGGNAALILDQRLGGDILTASASGTTRFTVQNDGDVQLNAQFANIQNAFTAASTSTLDTFDSAQLSATVTNIKAMYRFENNGNDSSTNGYNLTTTGSLTYETSDPTPRAGTYSVTGFSTSNYYTVNNSALPAATSGTIEFFWSPASLAANQYIWYATDGTDASYIYVDTSGVIHAKINNGTEITSTASVNQFPSLQRWYHIALTWDGTNWILYKDGVQINSTARAQTLDATTTSYIGINTGPATPVTGNLDEFRIVTASSGTAGALSAATIAQDAYWADQDKDNHAGSPIVQNTDSTIAVTTASEKFQVGAPQVDASTKALWHLDETSGSGAYFKDATGNANDLTPTGSSTLTTGVSGKARQFPGTTGNYLSLSGSSSLNITGNFSVEGWFMHTANASGSHGYVAWKNSGGTDFNLQLDYTGTQLRCLAGGTSLAYTVSPSLNTWFHAACTWDGSNGRIYYNGTQGTSGALANPGSSTNTWYVGTNFSDSMGHYGLIDEVRVSNAARTAEEIAEAYRAGRDHHITRTISSSDLSNKNKVGFQIASDRPGTYLEAMAGESAYANYEPDDTTVGLWHLEEQTNASSYVKDSTKNAYNGTLNGNPTFIRGPIGMAWNFDGSGDYVQTSSTVTPIGAKTMEAWVKTTSGNNNMIIMDNFAGTSLNHGFSLRMNAGIIIFTSYKAAAGDDRFIVTGNAVINDGNWHHVVGTWDGTTTSGAVKIYIDGKLDVTGTADSTESSSPSSNFRIGYDGSTYFTGAIDEVRVSSGVRSADDILLAYEIGLGKHTPRPITIEFVTSPNAACSACTTINLNSTAGLYVGDTMIIREKVGATEQIEQKAVTAINGNQVTLASALSNNYTTSATVFKWQKEYLDLSNFPPADRDAITNLTIRPTNMTVDNTLKRPTGFTMWLDTMQSTNERDIVTFANTSGQVAAGISAEGAIYAGDSYRSLGNLTLQASGNVAGASGNGSIYFADYLGQTRGRFDTQKNSSGNQSYGTFYLAATDTTNADVAEYYPTADPAIEAGDVVALASESAKTIQKADATSANKLLGIISTAPGHILGGGDGVDKSGERLVALAGRVPVKIDPDSPPIAVGDFLTSSDKPGLATKATRAGYTVGKALEAWQPGGSTTIETFVNLSWFAGELTQEGFLDTKKSAFADSLTNMHTSASESSLSATILPPIDESVNRSVEVGGVEPPQSGLTDLTPHRRTPTPDTIIASASAWLKENWDALSKQNVDIVKSLWVKTTLLTADVVAARDVVADNITIGGQSLRDYILDVVSQMGPMSLMGLMSPMEELKTNIISPIASESAGIAVVLGEGQTFGIYNKEASPAALFDAQGNATLAGALTVSSVQASQASISGTLYADRIVTRFGDLDEQLSVLRSQFSASGSSVIGSSVSDQPTTDQLLSDNGQLTTDNGIDATSSALLALLNGELSNPTNQTNPTNVSLSDAPVTLSTNLSVLGDTTLGRTSIAGSLLVDGAVRITKDGIETIGDTLYLQKNRFASLDIMNGSLVVDTVGNVAIKGNLAVGGNLTVGGTLSASTISPLADGDITISLDRPAWRDSLDLPETPRASESSSAHAIPASSFGRFIIRGTGGLAVASIDASGNASFRGDLAASGSGTFNKLFIASPEASTSGVSFGSPEVSTNTSIGVGVLPAGTTEQTIATDKVTQKSFIYITPIGTTSNRVLYLKSQTSGSGFVVALDQPVNHDIQFNWWIVN